VSVYLVYIVHTIFFDIRYVTCTTCTFTFILLFFKTTLSFKQYDIQKFKFKNKLPDI